MHDETFENLNSIYNSSPKIMIELLSMHPILTTSHVNCRRTASRIDQWWLYEGTWPSNASPLPPVLLMPCPLLYFFALPDFLPSKLIPVPLKSEDFAP